MTNVSATQEKLSIRARLFEIAEEALEKEGWTVERIARSGKASVRRITKGKVQKTVTIRTTQNTWIAFPRTAADDAWATLADVDYVVASSVDDPSNPQVAHVHLIDGDEMRARFDRAYEARRKAGYALQVGRGIWLSLYEKETDQPVTFVGAGAGIDHPAIATVPLTAQETAAVMEEQEEKADEGAEDEAPLSIADAKRRLALSFGVSETDVKITING